MIQVAYLISSAQQLTLEDGSTHPVAFLSPAEVLTPYERFTSAGAAVTVITPDGQPPRVETYGSSWFFDIPDEDSRYLASVVGTFARHVEDIVVTLHQYRDLGLTVARRVDALLRSRGWTAAQAHRGVSDAAGVAWKEDRPFAQVLAADRTLGLTLEQIADAAAAQRADSRRLTELRQSKLEAIPGFRHPVALASLTAADTEQFDALFVAGGYGAMTDLADNPDVGRLLVALHRRGVAIAALGHGPAALLSAPERADGLWLFDGYRMASITDEEEDQTEAGRLGMAWRLDVALKNAGAVFDDGPAAWVSHVVVDRQLITGQNPASTKPTADALLRRLGIQTPPHHATVDAPLSVEASLPWTRTPTESVQAFFDAITNRSVEAAMSLVSPQALVTVHPLKVAGAATDTLHQVLTDLLLAFSDLRIGVEAVITTDDVVTALFRAEGTQSADYAGAIDLNKHLDLKHAWRFVVVGGVITEVSAYWCQAQLYRRLAVKRYDQLAIA